MECDDWYSDPYGSPSKYGLTKVGEVEWSEPCWSFDLTAVWKDADGVFYWGSDSGCSCPTPFEGIRSKDELSRGSFFQCAAALQGILANRKADGWSDLRANAETDVTNLISRMREGN
ncbi:DUF7574 domain-containing protein [Glycomyces mayteni]|uniref:DUF7574 domain-containing protein n=1 Tax=Glycomyces mayteni TaxID=543887 RepID=UPI003D4AEA00|nr:hypothetical protein GCM10025732_47720 [Glycomyces mayteni]